jgi:hypothetical protein
LPGRAIYRIFAIFWDFKNRLRFFLRFILNAIFFAIFENSSAIFAIF